MNIAEVLREYNELTATKWWIVVGDRQAGKTTAMAKLAGEAVVLGLDVLVLTATQDVLHVFERTLEEDPSSMAGIQFMTFKSAAQNLNGHRSGSGISLVVIIDNIDLMTERDRNAVLRQVELMRAGQVYVTRTNEWATPGQLYILKGELVHEAGSALVKPAMPGIEPEPFRFEDTSLAGLAMDLRDDALQELHAEEIRSTLFRRVMARIAPSIGNVANIDKS